VEKDSNVGETKEIPSHLKRVTGHDPEDEGIWML
jgi:hypothetical protein